MANNKDVKRGIVLYLDGKQVENSASAVEREMRKVRKEINSCTIGSKEYVEATKRYRELAAILDEHKKKLRAVKEEQKDLITGVNDLWNKWQLAATAVAGAITGVGLILSEFRKQMNAEEEGADNLKALTGLDDESIEWLHKQAVELSTTMDETGLRVKASAKDILDAYTLVGSAKPELLGSKQALLDVTKESLRLAAAAKMDVKPAADGLTLAMNQYGAAADEASRYVNVLAAGSKFGAAGVESQTAAIVKAGVAANVANVPIESLVGSIETLAEKGIKGEVAGTGLKTFFLKLEGMADDVRPSVVGLQAALENLRKKNLSTAETQRMFGLEAYTVAAAMINGADKVRSYTEAVTDTNVAMEQAAINSDNANAKLEQMKNEFMQQGIVLVKELNPAITQFVSLCMNSTKVVVSLTRFMTENRVTMGLLTAAIGIYIAWINRKIIADKLATFWSDTLKASLTKLYATAMANPWGFVLVALTAVIGALIDYNRRQKEALENTNAVEKAQEKADKQFAEEAAKIDYLNKVLNDNNENLNRRKAALNELKKIVPEYLADLTEEGKLINDNKTAIDNYLKTLEKEIKLKAIREDLEQAYKEKRLAEKKKIEENRKLAETPAPSAADGVSGNPLTGGGYAGNVRRSNYEAQVARAENAKKDLERINKDIKSLEDELRKSDFVAGPGVDSSGSGGGGSSSTTSKKKVDKESDRIKKEVEAINLEIIKQQNAVRRLYADGVIDKRNYNQRMEDLEIERINRTMQIAGLEPQKIEELQQRILDMRISAREELAAMSENPLYEDESDETKAKEALNKLQQQYDERQALLVRSKELGLMTEEEYAKQSESVFEDFVTAARKITQEFNNEKSAFEKAGLEVRELAEDIGNSIGQALAGAVMDNVDDIKSAFKSVLLTIVDAIEKMILASEVETALLTLSGIGTAKGMANLAKLVAIKVAFAALKSGINSFEVGGFTGAGAHNSPAGIVHRGEFVANGQAVANPAIRSILDVIDSAQRAGTVASLTSSDLQSVGNNNYTPAVERDKEMSALVAACTTALVKVKERFDKPIVAETYATGKGSVNEAQDLVSRMNNNAKR